MEKAIYLLVVKNSFELITVTSNRTSFDIRYKNSSSHWYLRASVLKKKSDIWIICKFTDTHQCAVVIVKNGHM